MRLPKSESTTSTAGSRASRWGRAQRAIENHPLLATLYPLAKQSMIYLAGAVLLGLGNFVLVPMYTRFLTPTDFGAYALIEISLLIAVTTTQMGLGTTYLRWYAETEPAKCGEILASSVTAGLEWFFRLSCEPGRLWRCYLIYGTQFVALVLLEYLGLKKFS